jgi:hypothetical protein
MLESVAISSYQALCASLAKQKKPQPTFLEYLKNDSIKLADIPDANQFWIREIIRIAKR